MCYQIWRSAAEVLQRETQTEDPVIEAIRGLAKQRGERLIVREFGELAEEEVWAGLKAASTARHRKKQTASTSSA